MIGSYLLVHVRPRAVLKNQVKSGKAKTVNYLFVWKREKILSQALSPPCWVVHICWGSKTTQYKLLAECWFLNLKNSIKSESWFFPLICISGLRYITLKWGGSWCPWEDCKGWCTPQYAGLKCNLHIMLKAGQCPGVSLGIRTIFWMLKLVWPIMLSNPRAAGLLEAALPVLFHWSSA